MRISFTRVKERVSLAEVAAAYGVKLRHVGAELIGCCPLHGGDNPTAFHLNPTKNRWMCFPHCGYGDVIDFVSRLENCSLLEAAIQLAKQYAPELLSSVPSSIHPFLANRGFDRATLDEFGIKYATTGRWRGMITIPLHDHNGKFLGFMGRRLSHLEKGKYRIQRGLSRSRILFNLHPAPLPGRIS